MPFRNTRFNVETVELLASIQNRVCAEFSITDEVGRTASLVA